MSSDFYMLNSPKVSLIFSFLFFLIFFLSLRQAMPSFRNDDSTFPSLDLIKDLPIEAAVFECRSGFCLLMQCYSFSKLPWKQVPSSWWLSSRRTEEGDKRLGWHMHVFYCPCQDSPGKTNSKQYIPHIVWCSPPVAGTKNISMDFPYYSHGRILGTDHSLFLFCTDKMCLQIKICPSSELFPHTITNGNF